MQSENENISTDRKSETIFWILFKMLQIYYGPNQNLMKSSILINLDITKAFKKLKLSQNS